MIKNKLSVAKWPLKKKLTRRVGWSLCFKQSDRFAISHYSPPMKWIMHDLSRNKMAGINLHLTGASASEILGIQEDAVPGKRRLCNWPESFERTGRTCWATDIQLLSSFKDKSMAISGFMNVCKPYSKYALLNFKKYNWEEKCTWTDCWNKPNELYDKISTATSPLVFSKG